MMTKILTLLLFTFLFSGVVKAEKLKSLSLIYDELEQGAGQLQMRYLLNEQFLRIDSGSSDSDFILFDVKQKKIFSINHEDQTILKINQKPWSIKNLKLDFTESEQLLEDAPKINNNPVYQYTMKAGDDVCTRVYFIKDTYPAYMKVFQQYQNVLSGQQVAMLKTTPEELQTPCFLLDQVYHSGDYYLKGLPIQISFSRGYEKFLKSYKELEVEADLFVLPEGYKEYLPFAE